MTPRTLGVLLIGAGVVAGIGSGWLFAAGPLALAGAVVLTGGTIAVAIGALMLQRRSWDDRRWPPEPKPVTQELMRRITRRLFVVGVTVAPLMLAFGVYQVLEGRLEGWVFVVLGLLDGGQAITHYRAVKKLDSNPGVDAVR